MKYVRFNSSIMFCNHAELRVKERIKEYNKKHRTSISFKSVKNNIIGHLHKYDGIIYPAKRFTMVTKGSGHNYLVKYVAIDQMLTRKVITFYIMEYKIKNRKEG